MSSWLSSILCIVLWKRYGASHLNCLLAIFNSNLIIQKKLKVLYHFGYFFQTGFLVEPIFPACSPDFIGTVFGFNLTIESRRAGTLRFREICDDRLSSYLRNERRDESESQGAGHWIFSTRGEGQIHYCLFMTGYFFRVACSIKSSLLFGPVLLEQFDDLGVAFSLCQ